MDEQCQRQRLERNNTVAGQYEKSIHRHINLLKGKVNSTASQLVDGQVADSEVNLSNI